jgi:hypothetical protein
MKLTKEQIIKRLRLDAFTKYFCGRLRALVVHFGEIWDKWDNRPYEVITNLIAIEWTGLFFFAWAVAFITYASSEWTTQFLFACTYFFTAMGLLMVGYASFQAMRARTPEFKQRVQLLQFILSAGSWYSASITIFGLDAVIFLIPVTRKIAENLTLPVMLCVYPVIFVTMVMSMLAPNNFGISETTAIEAIIYYDKPFPEDSNTYAHESLWRSIWSYLIDRLESVFGKENAFLRTDVDFSQPLNAVALALAIGNKIERANAEEWLITLRSQLERGCDPSKLIQHIDAIQSKFKRWVRMQEKYSLLYIKRRGLRRLRPKSLVEKILLLILTALPALIPLYQLLQPKT